MNIWELPAFRERRSLEFWNAWRILHKKRGGRRLAQWAEADGSSARAAQALAKVCEKNRRDRRQISLGSFVDNRRMNLQAELFFAVLSPLL